MSALAESYDAALFDLDGVVYLGPYAIEGVPDALAELRATGVRLGFVTNNAARTPATVAEHLRELGIDASETDVVNSTQATLRLLRQDLPHGARILAVGTEALVEQLQGAGFTVVTSRHDEPVAVVQGYHPAIEWRQLDDAALAIQAGAQWYATNPDFTRPGPEGLVPGCGAQVGVIQLCVTVTPKMAGKPFRPLLDETVARLEAAHPLFVGDRLDTDILGAHNVGMDSLFVFTGAHGKADLASAAPDHRPTFIGSSVAALLQPAREVSVMAGFATCRGHAVDALSGVVHAQSVPDDLEGQLDVLWAGLNLAWSEGADVGPLLERLDLVR
ncbi:HAD-IIA family hydrolase [Tessaracoccus caeni]|uniref:HAD-IIA family hydrolase n=1 Tax=Tessaracoccus caeni TaxID=3031239 RepID=UPI0023DA77D5|nr:HAD-IIA family hydrolase [Tessaracoccus caeni]MDF1488035.1 HAD-IIA family hydrolase [Tessaracoccus caeni]